MSKHPRRGRNRRHLPALPTERVAAVMCVCEDCGAWWIVTPGIRGSARVIGNAPLNEEGPPLPGRPFVNTTEDKSEVSGGSVSQHP
jgi:hypothetical protein